MKCICGTRTTFSFKLFIYKLQISHMIFSCFRLVQFYVKMCAHIDSICINYGVYHFRTSKRFVLYNFLSTSMLTDLFRGFCVCWHFATSYIFIWCIQLVWAWHLLHSTIWFDIFMSIFCVDGCNCLFIDDIGSFQIVLHFCSSKLFDILTLQFHMRLCAT